MKTSIKYFIAFFLFTGIFACGKKDNAEPEEIKRDPNELPSEIWVIWNFFSQGGSSAGTRIYNWKFKPFYTPSKHVDSLGPIDDYSVTYKYHYNAKGQPLKLRITDHAQSSYSETVYTYNAEGTKWLSRKSAGEREDWDNAKYNAKGQRISVGYYQIQNATDSLEKGIRTFTYDEDGNVTWIYNTQRKVWNKTYGYWDSMDDTWVKYEYGDRTIPKTEQLRRFEESFVYGEHRPINYYGQSIGPNLFTKLYTGSYQTSYLNPHEWNQWGAVLYYGKDRWGSHSTHIEKFYFLFDYSQKVK